MTMKLVKRLYNRGQKMSTRQVLDTNDLTLKLTAQQHDLKEVWRRDQKTLFGKAMQAEYDHKSVVLASRYANSGKNCRSAKHGTIRVIKIWVF